MVSSRYYSPELCRWISPDSIEYLDPESINGLNLYAYCMNDPVNHFDPSGCFAVQVGFVIAIVILLVVLKSDAYNYDEAYVDKVPENVQKYTFNNGKQIQYTIEYNADSNKSVLIVYNSFDCNKKEMEEFFKHLKERYL